MLTRRMRNVDEVDIPLSVAGGWFESAAATSKQNVICSLARNCTDNTNEAAGNTCRSCQDM